MSGVRVDYSPVFTYTKRDTIPLTGTLKLMEIKIPERHGPAISRQMEKKN